MISYAQNYEDVLLARVFAGQSDGFYVDVGAADPVEHSVTKHFSDLGWRGVNVEPLRGYWERLTAARPRDVNLNAAAGAAHERREFFSLNGEYLSTLDPVRAAEVAGGGVPCDRQEVEVLTLAEVCERHAPDVTIDFLKIDVEGWEEAVIRGGDWHRFRPRVVLVEATEPNSPRPSHESWEPLLLEAGYLFAYFDGLNRYYVRREDEGLLAHFATPPNVFDQFRPYREQLLESQLAAVYAQRDELSQLYGREREAHVACQGQRDEYYHGREESARRAWDLSQERDALAAQRDALTAERDRLAAERDALTAERDRLAAVAAQTGGERDELRRQLEELHREQEEAHRRLDALHHDQDEALRRLDELHRERDRVAESLAVIARERDGLSATTSTLRDELSVLGHRMMDYQARVDRYVWEARALARQRDELRIERDRVVDERNHLDCRTRHLTQLLDELHASRFWRYTAWVRSLGHRATRAGRWVKARVAPRPAAALVPASVPAPLVEAAPAAPAATLRVTAKRVLRRLGGDRLVRLIERRIQNQVAPLQARDHEAAARIASLEAEVARLRQRALLTEMCVEAALRSTAAIESDGGGVLPGPGAAAACA